MSEVLLMRVWRGDATAGQFHDYTIERFEGEVVLDVLHRLQAGPAGDLAIRWNCKAGKCGSCSAEINGRPRLLCMTQVSSLPDDEPIVIAPMRAFPVIRDLVTDVAFTYAKLAEVAALAPSDPEADGSWRMQDVDVERSQEFRRCIECFLCQNVCHVVRDHEENKAVFGGPRVFIRLAELQMHPADTDAHRGEAAAQLGVGMCNITKCCTEVCPEGIKITDNAIIPLKEREADRRYDPLISLVRRLRGAPRAR